MLAVFQSGRRSWCCSLSGHLHSPSPTASLQLPHSLSLFPSLGLVTLPLTLCISISLYLDHSPRFHVSLESIPLLLLFLGSRRPIVGPHLTPRTQRPRTPPPAPHNPASFICLSWLISSLLSLVLPFFSHSPSTSYLSSPGCCTYSLPNAVQPLIFALTPAILPLIFS